MAEQPLVVRQKQRAAERAASLVESGMVLGLGAGSTAALAIEAVARRVAAGELVNLVGVPCSREVGRQAEALGLTIATLAEQPHIDLTIDGADEVDGAFDLIKGAGGALLHEKMVAQASAREIIVVDQGKLSPRLGTRARVPVEVIPFGWRAEEAFVRELGARSELRLADGRRFETDQGNFILDCRFAPIADAARLAALLDGRAGIAAHGLFVALASEVIVGVGDGDELRHFRRPTARV